jgi:hypothetical protein
VEKCEHDTEGRYVILTGQIGKKSLTLANLYVPIQDKPELQVSVF